MSLVRANDIVVDDRTLRKLTVSHYHRIVEQGLFPTGEPYELLDGLVTRKDRSAAGEDHMTVGHEHATAISRLTRLDAAARKHACHVRIQLPITVDDWNEPEPDAAIVRGTEADYRDGHPTPADVLCVIEAADASLRADRTRKLRIYASAGIPQYVILNLADRVAEVYTRPLPGKGRYGQSITLSLREKIELPTARKPLSMPVGKLLP